MIDKLKFWCHKIIPLVYDEALSYYEGVCKIRYKVNEIIESLNEVFRTAVFSVNNKIPVDGNVNLDATDFQGAFVGSINGITPDENGDIDIDAEDVGALPNSIDPVESVNGIAPDSNGNVNVGTVKSVNRTTPDADGNVNLPQVAGVTSVAGIGADSQGNVPLTAADLNIIPADSAPADLGTAAVGSSSKYARQDHVHKMPTASDVGALPASTSIPSPANANPANLGTAAVGSSTRYARQDHVHKMPTASDVGALPSSTVIPSPANADPSDLGTKAVGSSARYARQDHVHALPRNLSGTSFQNATISSNKYRILTFPENVGCSFVIFVSATAANKMGIAIGISTADGSVNFYQINTMTGVEIRTPLDSNNNPVPYQLRIANGSGSGLYVGIMTYRGSEPTIGEQQS